MRVFLSTLLQSQGLITGYLSVPDTLLTCSSSGVTPLLISVSPLYFSLLIASTHPLLPHPLSFFFFPITVEVKRKATMRKFSF